MSHEFPVRIVSCRTEIFKVDPYALQLFERAAGLNRNFIWIILLNDYRTAENMVKFSFEFISLYFKKLRQLCIKLAELGSADGFEKGHIV